MSNEIMVFGHRNPDTDSITSALALAHLKRKQGVNAIAYRLGELPKETQFVLDYFHVTPPQLIHNVKIQIKDILFDRIEPLKANDSILTAYNHMNKNKIRTLPIVNDANHLIGIVTMKDIAMNAINGDLHALCTTFENVKRDLNAVTLNYASQMVQGSIIITAFHDSTIIENDILNRHSVVITGDRYDIIEYAIRKKVQLIVVTGGQKIPDKLIERAAVSRVNMVVTPFDTYFTSKLINQTNFINTIMNTERIMRFRVNDYMEDCKDIIQTSKHSKFPIIDDQGFYLGIVGRAHFLTPTKKQVILVDHNEWAQSADGLNEAEILEIIDHHKIGDIATATPIAFRNVPVGSTNTIIYQMYQEAQVAIPTDIAGLMLSGIISDTLYLKSPTTTDYDIAAVKALSEIVTIQTDKFAMDMFKNGTSLEGRTPKDVFNNDFKSFVLDGYKIGISQVFTLNFEDILSDKDSYIHYMEDVHHLRDYDVTLMLVTDIINEGSYILYQTAHTRLLSLAFDKEVHQGVFIEECVSRKKQIVPKLIYAINALK